MELQFANLLHPKLVQSEFRPVEMITINNLLTFVTQVTDIHIATQQSLQQAQCLHVKRCGDVYDDRISGSGRYRRLDWLDA